MNIAFIALFLKIHKNFTHKLANRNYRERFAAIQLFNDQSFASNHAILCIHYFSNETYHLVSPELM